MWFASSPHPAAPHQRRGEGLAADKGKPSSGEGEERPGEAGGRPAGGAEVAVLAAVGEEGPAQGQREPGDVARAGSRLGQHGAEHGAEDTPGMGDREGHGVGGRSGPGAVDVGEDRRAAVELAVEGEHLALGGKGRLALEQDLGREVSFADQRAAAERQRVGVGGRLDLVESAERQARGAAPAKAVERDRDPP